MIRQYNENHCWQYDIRLNNREQDLKDAELTEDDVKNLKVGDFTIAFEEKSLVREEVKEFIVTVIL